MKNKPKFRITKFRIAHQLMSAAELAEYQSRVIRRHREWGFLTFKTQHGGKGILVTGKTQKQAFAALLSQLGWMALISGVKLNFASIKRRAAEYADVTHSGLQQSHVIFLSFQWVEEGKEWFPIK